MSAEEAVEYNIVDRVIENRLGDCRTIGAGLSVILGLSRLAQLNPSPLSSTLAALARRPPAATAADDVVVQRASRHPRARRVHELASGAFGSTYRLERLRSPPMSRSGSRARRVGRFGRSTCRRPYRPARTSSSAGTGSPMCGRPVGRRYVSHRGRGCRRKPEGRRQRRAAPPFLPGARRRTAPAGRLGEFGAPRNGGRVHKGFDVDRSRCETPLAAATTGTIVKRAYDPRLDGNYIVIRGLDERRKYWYATHGPSARPFQKGDLVHVGQIVGHVGKTGNARTRRLPSPLRDPRQRSAGRPRAVSPAHGIATAELRSSAATDVHAVGGDHRIRRCKGRKETGCSRRKRDPSGRGRRASKLPAEEGAGRAKRDRGSNSAGRPTEQRAAPLRLLAASLSGRSRS